MLHGVSYKEYEDRDIFAVVNLYVC